MITLLTRLLLYTSLARSLSIHTPDSAAAGMCGSKVDTLSPPLISKALLLLHLSSLPLPHTTYIPHIQQHRIKPSYTARSTLITMASDRATVGAALPNTPALDDLKHAEEGRLLNTCEGLRACGAASVLSMTRIVVCGDQSVGKSSALEGITRIKFPCKENMCTRFATEIDMRRHPINSVRIRIIPDASLPKSEQDRLKSFDQTLTSFDDVSRLTEEAADHMQLNKADKPDSIRMFKAFSRNILRIEIEGPDRIPLTLVDLPGLIQSPTSSQTDADIDLIRDMVDSYIKNPRTIILAVISAKTDHATQGILRRCHNVDPKGERTLGIITKPDQLEDDPELKKTFLNLAQNKEIKLQLGWHILKNRQVFPSRSYTSFTNRKQICQAG